MKTLHLLLFATFTMIAGLPAVFAQDVGRIDGTVYLTDSDSVVTDAKVTIVGMSFAQSVDERGNFVFENVPAGSVLLRVESPIWGQKSQNITVTAGETVYVDIEIQLLIHLEELIVSAGPTALTRLELVNPVHVVSGIELRESAGINLGESLMDKPGITSSYYGPGASRPIIGGIGGSRVKILQNGLDIGDVSDQSEDHSVGVEAFDSERIEIIRGPATLLYGSDITGGVVNVMDGRIPTQRPVNRVEGMVMGRGGLGAEERGGAGSITGSFGNVVWRARGLLRETGDVSTPLFNPEGILGGHDDHDHEEDEHDDDHDHEEDEHDDDHDKHETEGGVSMVDHIDNSRTSVSRGSFGMTWLGTRGYIGASVSMDRKDYGIPGHAHDHGHDEDEHDEHDHDEDKHDEDEHEHDEDEHDEDEHDEDEHDHDEDEHDEHGHEEGIGIVTTDLESVAYDLQGAYRFGDQGIKMLRFRLGLVDYNHSEIEQVEEGEDGVGAVYDNHQFEGRLELDHSLFGTTTGVAGLQFKRRDLDVSGSHASQPKTVSNDFGIFAMEQLDMGSLRFEFSGRMHFQSYDPEGKKDRSFALLSVGAGLNYEVNKNVSLSMSLARATKTPSASELYSDGLHTAIRSIELGNVDLDPEVTINSTVSGHLQSDLVDLTLTGYINHSSNFIYFARTGDVEGELPVLQTSQSDARILGVELDSDIRLIDRGKTNLTLGLTGDYTRGQLTSVDGNLPRMPPMRVKASLQYSWSNVLAKFSVRHVATQDQLFFIEEETEGYTMIDAKLRYRLIVNSTAHTIALQGFNLTNTLARLHTSLLKDTVPLPGRDIRLTYTFHF